MRSAIYTQYRKARHSTEAMVAGFPGALETPSEPGQLADADLHLLGGLQFGSLPLLQQIYALRAQFVFWDRAYFGGGTHSDRLRITKNQYQKCTVNEQAGGLHRFEAFGGRLLPWRGRASHIMVVPPSDAILTMFVGSDLPNRQQAWIDYTLEAIRKGTDRPILVSMKGDARPLDSRLKHCHAVVTYTSNVAVEAICAGVPAFTSHLAAAAPVAGGLHDLSNAHCIENPPMPDDATREAWAASLAWGQFTLAEIRSGLAREVVLGRADE